MPDARCTRGLVCNGEMEAHTSIQVQRRHSGIPCAMVLRLTSCSSRRRIPFATVTSGLRFACSPVGPTHLRWLDISHGCQNHTTSPYAATSRQNADRRCRPKSWRRPLKRRSSAQRAITHGTTRPATTIAPDAAASTASNPASVTIAIRPSCRGGTRWFYG
jgi:hypothetical protein